MSTHLLSKIVILSTARRTLIKTWIVAGLLALSTPAWSLSCAEYLSEGLSSSTLNLRDLSEIKELNIMAYNVENLFAHVGAYDHASAHELVPANNRQQKVKSEFETKWIQKIMADKTDSPDVIILEEVENIEALRQLVKSGPLKGLYHPFLIEGNDSRGIDIGFLVKIDLPFIVDIETHKDQVYFDPIEKKQIRVFSRDVPALIFRLSEKSKPFLVVLGEHGKSKRDRPGDPESNILRTQQNIATADIVKGYEKRFGSDTPIILGGDFNTDVRMAPEVEPLRAILTSAFDVAKETVPYDERITHSFHPRDGPAQYSQIDDLRVNQVLRDQIVFAKVIPYFDENGKLMPLPKTYQEREKQPSDHRPIKIKVSTAKMF